MSELTGVTAPGLLDAWERASFVAPAARAATLLAPLTDEELDSIARLPLGARDRLLLDLRRRVLGSFVDCEAHCPACGERLELGFEIDQIQYAAAPVAGDHLLDDGDTHVRFRLPATCDLVAGAGAADTREAARRIVAGCVIEALNGGAPIAADALSDAVLEDIAQRCCELDPQADVQIDLACAACGQRWQSPFDIASFLWLEIEAWAARTLEDIHLIASYYGWTEREILDLSPSRRRWYVERIQA